MALQFSNVFTIEGENTCNIEEKTLPDSKLAISFDAATILEKLNGLVISKSPGPDLVNAKILKELAEPIAPVFLKRHMKLVVYRQNGRKQTLVVFTKKETSMIQKFTTLLA